MKQVLGKIASLFIGVYYLDRFDRYKWGKRQHLYMSILTGHTRWGKPK